MKTSTRGGMTTYRLPIQILTGRPFKKYRKYSKLKVGPKNSPGLAPTLMNRTVTISRILYKIDVHIMPYYYILFRFLFSRLALSFIGIYPDKGKRNFTDTWY